jgi:hypothetical protein
VFPVEEREPLEDIADSLLNPLLIESHGEDADSQFVRNALLVRERGKKRRGRSAR